MRSMATRVRAAVAGANGYAGMTLVHLLARHPHVAIEQLSSRSLAGKPFASTFPLLSLEGEFLTEVDATKADVVFSCLPHNVRAAKAAAWLGAGARVIDMSAHSRLKYASPSPTSYPQHPPAP